MKVNLKPLEFIVSIIVFTCATLLLMVGVVISMEAAIHTFFGDTLLFWYLDELNYNYPEEEE